MKNYVKVCWLIAIVAILGLAFVGCGGEGGAIGEFVTDDSGGGGGGGGAGSTLKLSGNVYTMDVDLTDSSPKIVYKAYNGPDINVEDPSGGSGKIKNGKLSYEIGVPDYTFNIANFDIEDEFGGAWTDITISDPSAEGFIIQELDLDSEEYGSIMKGNFAMSINASALTETTEMVWYVYVDKAVKITGKGVTNKTGVNEYTGVPYKITSNALNLSFKKGWNAVYLKASVTVKFDSNLNPINTTSTINMTLSDPALKWILDGFSNPTEVDPEEPGYPYESILPMFKK